jgi:hypothetical protein
MMKYVTIANKNSKHAMSRLRLRRFSSIYIAVACGLAVGGQVVLSDGAKSSPLFEKPNGKDASNHPYNKVSSKSDGLLHRVQMANSDFMVMNVSGKADEPLKLDIALPQDGNSTYRFLMFRGLPPKFSLSSGFAIKNQWAVSLKDLPGLRLIPPPHYSGSFHLEVRLMKDKGNEAESRVMKVEFLPGRIEDSVVTGATQPALQSQRLTAISQNETNVVTQQKTKKKNTPPTPREMTDEDQLMLERGDLLFRQGDVAAARLIYNRMAKQGMAPAALAMGQTYDLEVLKPLNVAGLRPDAAKARVWYKLAADLGNQQAKNRLLTLRDTK